MNAVLVTAARRRLLLPTHMGRHTHQRAQYHRHHRVLGSDICHASAGGVDSMRAVPVQPAEASSVTRRRGDGRARMEHGQKHAFVYACAYVREVCAARAAPE